MKTKEKIIWLLIGFIVGVVLSSTYRPYLIVDLMDGMFGK